MLTHRRRKIVRGVTECDETHIHGCYEIYVNVSGTVFFLVNDCVYLLGEGGVVFTRPNDVHVCFYPQDGVYECFCLWIEDPQDILFANTHTSAFCPYIQMMPEESKRLLEMLVLLKNDDGSKLFRTAILLELLLLLENNKHNDGLPMSAQVPDQMQRILLYMSEAFLEIHHIGEVCEMFHISRPTLNRWFLKYTGISPGAFMESKKLAHAKHLLDSGETVSRAAFLAGFSDCSRFIGVFKKKFGMTPKTYQRQNRIETEVE